MEKLTHTYLHSNLDEVMDIFKNCRILRWHSMVVNSVSLSKPGKEAKYIAVLNVYVGIDERKLHCAQYLIHSNGLVESRNIKEFLNRFLYSSVYQWCKEVGLDMYSKKRIQKRTMSLKKEIIAAVWHPTRVAKWVEAGIALEDL